MGIANGFKRLLAGFFSVIAEVLRAIPGAEKYIAILEMIAGFFGIAGITHASVKGTITRKRLATASAAVASLLLVTYLIPALEPLRPHLEKLSGLLGAAALGAVAKEKEAQKDTGEKSDKL